LRHLRIRFKGGVQKKDNARARPLPPGRAPSASACEPFRELFTQALARGRNAMAIWQDLVDVLKGDIERCRQNGQPPATATFR
jgi:hypothetical protein